MDQTAFLLAQVGALAATRFADRLSSLDLSPAHAGVIRILALSPGLSQRALADRLAILPARLVGLIDSLEQRGLVERRRDTEDRRNHCLHLTDAGRSLLGRIGQVAMEHQADILKDLSDTDREALGRILRHLADAHGLTAGVHPGFRTL